MAGLSPSGAASKIGMSVTEATVIAIAILKILREKLISVHLGGLAARAGSSGGAGTENHEIVLGRLAELFE